jgi:hypothetical protein
MGERIVSPKKVRRAVIKGETDLERVAAFMPSNYSCFPNHAGEIFIVGFDEAGWTLDGYVIPRLASGLIIAEEIIHGS